MKKKSLVSRKSMPLLVLALGAFGPASAQHENRWGQPVANELIVQLRSVPESGDAKSLKLSLGVIPIDSVESLVTIDSARASLAAKSNRPAEGSRLMRVVLPSGSDADAALARLRTLPEVEFAEPNYSGRLVFTPNDPLYPAQASDWDTIGVAGAWQAQIDAGGTAGGSPGVRVAVIDSGVDATHEDLAIDSAASWNFVDNDNSVFDDLGHGTRVAGIIGARGDNSVGMAGIAFGCTLVSLDVADGAGVVTTARVASAINYAAAHDCRIANLSVAFNAPSTAIQQACDAAAAQGMLLVAAAGNENQGSLPTYPASLASVVGVGALDEDGQHRAPFSNYSGTQRDLVELVAPGVTILSTTPGSQYDALQPSGTSYSTAVVSGVAALLASSNPAQRGAALRAHLAAAAADPGAEFLPAGGFGEGRVDAAAAVGAPFAPVVSVSAVIVNDTTAADPDNDSDGVFDRAESATFLLRLTSTGGDAVGVHGTLSTTDADILSLGNTESDFGAVRVGATTDNTAPFGPFVISDTAVGHLADLTLQLTGDNGFSATLPVSLRIEDEVTLAGVLENSSFVAEKTYRVTGNLLLRGTASFAPGTKIRLNPGISILASTSNVLTAQGTEDAPIVFTSSDPAGAAKWGNFRVSPAAVSVLLDHVIVENGAGILVELPATTISNCVVQDNAGTALSATVALSQPVTNSRFLRNTGAGVSASTSTVSHCESRDNTGAGFVVQTITDSSSVANGDPGIQATTIARCESTDNEGVGILLFGTGGTDLASLRNSGLGIHAINNAGASLTRATSQFNGGGGVYVQRASRDEPAYADFTDCNVSYNIGIGTRSDGGTHLNCTIKGNTNTGIIAVDINGTIQDCVIEGNKTGISTRKKVAGTAIVRNGVNGGGGNELIDFVGCYVAENQGIGIKARSLADCVVISNMKEGIQNIDGELVAIGNSFIGRNGAKAIVSVEGKGVVTNTAFVGNAGGGTLDIMSASASNFIGNGTEVLDTHSAATEDRIFENNYWGSANTALLNAAPTFANMPFITDVLDASGAHLVDVWPYSSAPVPNAPDYSQLPGFLLDVSPDGSEPMGIGNMEVLLTFSAAMDTTETLAVTFGPSAPYTSNIVAADPGWTNDHTWRGSFWIQDDTGTGLQTLAVSGAVDATGFHVPDDLSHRFTISITGGLSGATGAATVLGQSEIQVTWSGDNAPADTTGFNVLRRATDDPGTFVRVNDAPLAAGPFVDSGLVPDTDYTYRIDVVRGGTSALQWTPSFSARTDPMIPGDTNSDGVITPADAQAAFDCYLTGNCTSAAKAAADVCPGTAGVTPGDAQGIFSLYLGLSSGCAP